MLDLQVEAVLRDDYGIAKGFFAENFVAQELIARGNNLYSWTERNAEIEFLLMDKADIVPLEVKAGSRTQVKSLQQYIQKYSPANAIILSNKPFHNKEGKEQHYIPLYLAGYC